ncbi:MAG: nucleotide pyrophosphohydrolase [Gammaproteobacteria bacterium]|nr:nucleotide pyrophosphohydrolase [Gammaproteobacteria bacterium]
MDLNHVKAQLRAFAEERDWDQFHNPKNLVMALAGECGELLALFQWLTPEQAAEIAQDAAKFRAVEDEVADVFIYLVRLADKLGVDLERIVARKMAQNAAKYPVAKARGNCRKYTELQDE